MLKREKSSVVLTIMGIESTLIPILTVNHICTNLYYMSGLWCDTWREGKINHESRKDEISEYRSIDRGRK